MPGQICRTFSCGRTCSQFAMRSSADLHASASFDEGQELSDRLQPEDAPCIPDPANGSSALKKSYKSLRGHTSDLTGLNIDFSELAGQVVRTGLDGDDRYSAACGSGRNSAVVF
mmetsp:Transcript_27999/g.93021  ORF Transcript_27999/g.93021 Transcript_27999/m.93021 type:complete len:114 (-) Transcript_27999:93-434(-)